MRPATLAAAIRKAFCQPLPPLVPSPPPLPGSEFWQETVDFRGKSWEALSLEDYQRNAFCFAFLGPEMFAYYFGAFMYLSLRAGVYQNNALEMLLEGWGSAPLDGGFVKDPDAVIGEFSAGLRSALNARQVQLIHAYFRTRAAFLRGYDDTELVEAFLAALAGPPGRDPPAGENF